MQQELNAWEHRGQLLVSSIQQNEAKQLIQLLENSRYAAKAAEVGEMLQTENRVRVACDAIENCFNPPQFHHCHFISEFQQCGRDYRCKDFIPPCSTLVFLV